MEKKDKRSKGCPNEACEMHRDRVKQSPEMNYCPKCGETLIFVCNKCFCEIEDISPDHKICASCEAIQAQKKNERIEKMKKAGKTAGTGVIALGTAVIAKASPQLQKAVIDKGAKIFVDLGKKVLKL